jgi:hypothetical protein
MAPQDQAYTNTPQYTLIVFDVRIPGTVEALSGWRAAWQGKCDIGAIDKEHFVLVIHAGMARSPQGERHERR